MNFTSDLCTLGTLTESTLLCSIEQRRKDELTESYVGSVLLSLRSPNEVSSPHLFLSSFTSSVLRSLVFSSEDQSILINGPHTSDNHALAQHLLAALFKHIDPQSQSIAQSITLASELLEFLCCCDSACGGAVIVVAPAIHPSTLTIPSAMLSCLLLDTSCLAAYKVFSKQNGFQYVENCLDRLGMQQSLVRNLILVLKKIQDLLTGVHAGTVLSEICRSSSCHDPPSSDTLAQLLYAYVVQWVVCWLNSNCLGSVERGGGEEGDCTISIICAPGHITEGTISTSGLPTLITRYASEVLHNLCCSRLFVWEQDQYMEEGIEWDTVEVEYNESLINAFHQEGGLLQVFDLPTISEMKAGIEVSCHFSSDTCFMSGCAGDQFTLAHFTGESQYTIDSQWLVASRVHVVEPEVQAALQTSHCDLLVDMAQSMQYSADVLPNSERCRSCKLNERAKVSMEAVCELITTSQPHFVFCLRPYKEDEEAFNSEYVLSQLQQYKILDIALIQSCGFPIRLKHSHFVKNYEALFVDSKSQVLTDKEKCFSILDRANLKEWHIGKTMVMLKPWHSYQLDAALDLFNQSAKKLQRVFRQSISRKKIVVLPKSISTDTCPPSPPPRPSHTLPTAQPTTTDYDRATSPSTSTVVRRKKPSWRKSSSSSSRKSISTSSDLKEHVWFQGKLSREKAEERLKLVQFDCFLIRESESRVGEYALSLRHAGIIKHFRVDTKRGASARYELYGAKRSFPSVEELVDYYSHHCISSGGELLTSPFSSEQKQTNPVPLKRKLSSIRRPKPALATVPVTETRLPRTQTTPTFTNTNHQSPFRGQSIDLSGDSMAKLRKELEVEEKIVAAARRMAELPSGNRRERHKRKQSLQQAQSRLLSLRQQFHTLQERQMFIEAAMQHQ